MRLRARLLPPMSFPESLLCDLDVHVVDGNVADFASGFRRVCGEEGASGWLGDWILSMACGCAGERLHSEGIALATAAKTTMARTMMTARQSPSTSTASSAVPSSFDGAAEANQDRRERDSAGCAWRECGRRVHGIQYCSINGVPAEFGVVAT